MSKNNKQKENKKHTTKLSSFQELLTAMNKDKTHTVPVSDTTDTNTTKDTSSTITKE